MRSHNIVGSEATTKHRLLAFSHAHGAMQMLPRRATTIPTLLAFAAGVASVFAVALLIGRA